MRKYGKPWNVVTDGLCYYLAAMKQQEGCGGLTDRERTQSPADLRPCGVSGRVGVAAHSGEASKRGLGVLG